MKIEKIELNGFKSFADRTVFNLHNGITCIVGPNGCGKSNIVDAFRWVLGEQSAKTLRGGKMEEVIFDGSAVKKPKGMADVTLHISGLGGATVGNGNGSDDTITVSRRLYRSGDSEYMINKNVCRLKDIRDMFLDTGLEVKSYSIIEQGHIDRILNTKPLDRRFLIEEVAGVMKYKARKAEALSKLESSRLNLQRINDVISEVKKQIKTLDRLAKKAERYKVISEELKDIELKISKKNYSELGENHSRTDSSLEETKEKSVSLRTILSTKESDHEKEKLTMVHLEKELYTVSEEFQSLERKNAEIQKQIAVLTSETENIRTNSARLSNQITELDARISSLSEKSVSLGAEKNTLSARFENFSLSVSEKNDFISGIEAEITEIESSINEKRKEIFSITDSLSSLNNNLTRLQSITESMSKKEDGHARELEEITFSMNLLEENISGIDSSIRTKNSDLTMANGQKTALADTMSSTKENIEDLRKTISSLKEDLASDSSRLNSLVEISSDGLTKDVLNQSDILHVAGVISDIISVDTRYEKAIESVLSEKISGIILSSFDDIQSAVRYIKDKSLMRTALMTAESMSFEEFSVPSHPSVIGRARDFLSTEETFAPIIGKILNNIIIIQDLKSAHELQRNHAYLTFVTPEGDILDPTNTVWSGEGKGILKRKREIRELEDRIHDRKNSLGDTEQELSRLIESLLEHEKEASCVEETIIMIEKEISVHKNEIQNFRDERERLQKKNATIKMEMEQTRQEKDALLKSVNDTRSRIEETTAKRAEMERSLETVQHDLAEKKEFYEQYRSDLTNIKLEMTSYREKIDALSKEIMALKEAIDESNRVRETVAEEIAQNNALIQQKTDAIGGLDEKLKQHIIQIDGLRSEIASKKEEIESRAHSLSEMEKQIRGLRNEIEEVSQRVSSLEVARTESRLKMENIFNNIIQMYGINIELHETSYPTEEEIEKLPSLRTTIQSIGPVNLATIEEYEELKERYEFLTTQGDDLTKSIEELEEAIKKINYTTRKRLRDAYTQLNDKFSEVFMHLFGGGKANLVLTDEQNILESGIDIIAQPPGKKLQNITLLSGGEKALTAISLTFAGFLIKPAPICILDEADAPLDESNSGKYAAIVRELSKDTQFIVITHNRTTMEAADYIYGITMEEPGASKVISMQLTEA